MKDRTMRIIMIGTGPFAAPTFRAMVASRHEVVLLVTMPLRYCRDRRTPMPCPMRDVARETNIPVFDPEDVNAPDSVARLRQEAADLLVVCDYGQILSSEALGTARLGGINLHGSLLPKYRGAAPVNWAIYHGEAISGVTVIHMTPAVDAGPCIAQASTPIGPEETAVELEARLCQLGAGVVLRAIDAIEAGEAKALPQDAAEASRAPRLKKTDGLIDWSRPAVAIKNHIRAMEPWPKTYTFWLREGEEPQRLILGPVSVLNTPTEPVAPGTILEAAGDRLVIAAGRGAVLARSLQPAGRRMLAIEEFLRGYPVRAGEKFGSA